MLVLLFPPNLPLVLSDLIAGVAVIVGVKSDLVMVAALLKPLPLRFGANVGRFLDTNGRMTGVNVRFLLEKVKRDLTRPFGPISSSSSSSSSSVLFSSSALVLSSFKELSITTGDGLIGAAVAAIPGDSVAVGASEGAAVFSTIKLDVLSII